MELVTDNLLPRILLTIVAFGYGVVTIKADFNATHATNPQWTPHARFHVVWQVLSYFGIAVISLGLIWVAGPMEVERLYLAAALGGVVLAGFFGATFARRRFGGAMYDGNGYPPFKPPFAPANWSWDLNITIFTALAAILAGGVLTT